MAITLVAGQTAQNTSAAGAPSAVLTNNPTTGNFVVALTWVVGSTTATCVVKDANNNTYAQTTKSPFGGTAAGASVSLVIAYLASAPANASKTITATWSTGTTSDLWVAEYSGVATSTPLENDATLNQTTGGTIINLPSITTVNNGDLLVGIGVTTGTISAANAPWTLLGTVTASGSASEYFIQSTAGAQALAFAQGGISNTWDSMEAAFKAQPAGGGVTLGKPAGEIFIPGVRQGPTRGLRPTQNFSPPPRPPFVFVQDSPRWRSTAAAVLVLANLNTSFVPQPPAPPTLSWLQPFAIPQRPAPPRYDLNQGWVPQVPSAVVAPPASIETDSSQPGPVYQTTALYQAFATLPPPAAPVVVAPPIGWLQPFAVPPQLLRRYDLNTAWVPQASFPAPTPSNLEWLQAFPTRTAPRPFYDLNTTWVPQPSFNAAPTKTLEWLSPFPTQTARRPVYDVNQGWVPSAPVVTLGWLQPFATPLPTARLRYDLNSGWVPQVPPAVVVTPPSLGWLQPAAVPPRETLVFDTIIEPFALPAPPLQASAEVDIAQPGPVYTRTFIYQSLFAPPQPVGGVAPIVTLPLESDSSQPGPIYQRLALYQAFATLPPQPPAVVIAPPLLGWLSSFDQFYRQTYLYQSLIAPPPQPPAAVIPAPPFGWFTQATMPPRETVVANTVLSPFALPEIPIWGWYQPFGIPRQPVRLWDWNTPWGAVPPPAFAITPSTLGWLQPFPIPPQPPRRPTFNEIYVPQNVGGTAPPPPTVLQPGGASVPHTFSRKRWRELQALIAAENAAVAKAERLTKESKREPLLKAARAAAAAIDAADKEGESKRLDALLLRNADSLRRAIRAATDVKRIREAANAIELSNAIVARTIEDEEDEMIQLLLLLS